MKWRVMLDSWHLFANKLSYIFLQERLLNVSRYNVSSTAELVAALQNECNYYTLFVV
jgi:hypothetical protein